jgi:hypothetical protein|tara:strand:+ start:2843 stop:3712 length:870 start_codon:yes stop_codon:yes gene_type:complete
MRRVRTRARRAPASIVARAFAVAVACVTARTVTASTPVEDECPCLSIHDPRFSCAPVAHADAMPTETIRRVREAAIERAKTHGWERTRPKHDYVDETREVKGRDLPETVRDELRRTFDERLAPLAREQCMIDEKMKFENHEFYVVKYDAVNFPSVAQHVDEKHVTFLVSLNNVTEYAGGGNQFQGMGFSVPHGGPHALHAHDVPAQPIGSVIIHGAQMHHSSHDVTGGERYVLVVETHVNKSCCWDFTAYMNSFVTRLLIVLFLIVGIMTGVLDWIQKRIKKEKHEKIW